MSYWSKVYNFYISFSMSIWVWLWEEALPTVYQLYSWSSQDFYHKRLLDFIRGLFLYYEMSLHFLFCFFIDLIFILTFQVINVSLYSGLHLSVYLCWTNLASFKWCLLNHGGWSFSCVLGFGFKYFIEYFCLGVNKGIVLNYRALLDFHMSDRVTLAS